jgi:lipopolysaccharide biosynthesis regulator YciM
MGSELSLDLIVALFVAAAAGFLAARAWPGASRPERTPSAKRPPAGYFQGLSFILNEEPDKALEVFLRMVEVDNDTVETHFALGNLYRRRGEVDRAIRVHENIIARPSLSEEHRAHARFALGEDYFRAGLFDRAEALFQELAGGSLRDTQALRYLLRIYEQQRDWEQAIATYDRLIEVASPEHPTAIAHYYCELAERARGRVDFATAREHLRAARRAQRNFPRSALIRADIALDMNEPELAALLCQRIVELHPRLLPLALPRVMRALRSDGEGTQGDLERRFRAWISPEPAARAEIAYAAIVAGLEEEAFVRDCLPDLVREDPSLGELTRALAGDPTQLTQAQLSELGLALGRVFRRTQRYRCVDCGFAAAGHFWQCPGCRSWDAFAPVALLDVTPGISRR